MKRLRFWKNHCVASIDQMVAIAGSIVGAIGMIAGTTIAIMSYRSQERERLTALVDDQPRLKQAINNLAATLQQQWRDEEARRRLNDPFPLTVGWESAPDDLFDHLSDGGRSLPDGAVGPEMYGRLDSIADVFEAVPKRRLVVLGDAGFGKTVLAIRFTLEQIDRRRDGDAVPVIFGIGSWNPDSSSLQRWIVNKLLEMYPSLRAPLTDGSMIGVKLVQAGKVIPVLDGFDEMTPDSRESAISAINAYLSPLLLTSRCNEYKIAVDAADVITGAAAIRLLGVRYDDLCDYLPYATRKGSGPGAATKWGPVLDYVREHPSKPEVEIFLRVMSTPLMVSLARTVYCDHKGRDPAEILAIARGGGDRALEGHLLDSFVAAAYHLRSSGGLGEGRPLPWDLASIEWWLEAQALRLKEIGSSDILWWKLSDSVPRPVRMLIASVCGGVVAGSLSGFAWQVGAGLGLGFGAGIGLGESPPPKQSLFPLQIRGRTLQVRVFITSGLAGGLTGGSLGGLAVGAEPFAERAAGDASTLAWNPPAGFLAGLVAACAGFTLAALSVYAGKRRQRFDWQRVPSRSDTIVGSLEACACGLVWGLLAGIALGVTAGLMLGLSVGLVTGLAMAVEGPIDTRRSAGPIDLLEGDRRNAIHAIILFGLAFGPAIGVGTGLAIGIEYGLFAGIGSALTMGLGVGIGYTAWGRWLIFTRIWMVITGNAPRDILFFLADAHQRGVLRQAGHAYQFRHARLRNRFAERARIRPNRNYRVGESHTRFR